MENKNKKEIMILFIKEIYKYFSKTIIFIIKTIIFILSKINLLLDKTGKKPHILTALSIAITIFSLKTIYQRDIDLYFFDMKIRNAEARSIELSENKENIRKEYEKLLEDTVFKKVTEFSKTKQEQCIQENIVNFLKHKRDEGIIVDDNVIELARIDLKRNDCNIETINEEVHKHLVEIPYEKLLLTHKEKIKEQANIENQKLEEKAIKLEEKIFNQGIKKQENVSKEENIHQAGFIDEVAKDLKTDQDIKAVFCLHGHGTSANGKYDDNGANGITTNERTAIVKNMHRTCDKLKSYYKDKNVKVYEIGYERMRLIDRIHKVNEISEKEGYNHKNSVLVELHWNKVQSKPNLKGPEVFYSESKNKKDERNVAFAQRMMFEIKQLKSKSNHYAVKPDSFARWKRIGILSDTIPNAILVEYGFLSNVEDDREAYESPEYISDSIFNGIVKYVNK